MLPFMTQPTVAPACYVPPADPSAALLLSGVSSYLKRINPTASNLRRGTLLAWIDRRTFGAQQTLWCCWDATTTQYTAVLLLADDRLEIRDGGATVRLSKITSRKFRSSGPLHIAVQFDMDAAQEDRVKLFVNLEPIRDWNPGTVPGSIDMCFNQTGTGWANQIGAYNNGTNYGFGGLIHEIIWVDGRLISPTSVATVNIHGVAVPRSRAEVAMAVGDVGINGWWLDFSEKINPGKDISGKGNHFTAVNIDGTGKDTVISTPNNVYATLNPVYPPYPGYTNTYGKGGLTFQASGGFSAARATIPFPGRGKWFVRGTATARGNVAFGLIPTRQGWGAAAQPIGYQTGEVAKVYGGGFFAGTSSYLWSMDATANSTDLLAVDVDAGKAWWGNETSAGAVTWYSAAGAATGDPANGLNPTWTFTPGTSYTYVASGTSGVTVTVDFGQGSIAGRPAGYSSLCTSLLPEPDIKDPAEAFAQATATGADIVAVLDAAAAHWNGQWVEIIKRSDASEDWRVRFSDDPGNAWATNNALAKAAAPALAAAGNYVGYRLRVGARYGVYTAEVDHATGTATTVSHGLNTARNVVIATRVSVGGGSRYLRHPDMDAGKLMVMGSASPGCVGDASLTDFAANSFRIAASAPSGVYRVVVLAERHGLLSLTAHTGNGAADGAFVPTDVLPHLAMIVETTTSGDVRVWDAARAPGNPVAVSSTLTSAAMESSAAAVDFVVGGVKLRSSAAILNGSGTKYLGVVWGRPVGGVCVAPATAR